MHPAFAFPVNTKTSTFTHHPFTTVQKMKPIVHFLAAAFLCFGFSAQAQQITTTFTPASTNITVGQNIAIDLMVTGFTDILAMQFPVTYDSTVLKLESITNPFHNTFKTVLTIDPNGNNVIVKPNGKLAVAWEANLQQFPNGMTLANGPKRLFTINFKVLKACSINVNLSGSAPPPGVTSPNFTNKTGVSVPVNFASGAALIGGDCPVPVPTYTGTKVIANNIYIPQGEVGCMPVTANGHINIEAFQYSMKWTNIPTVSFEAARPNPVTNVLPGFDPTYFTGFNPAGYAAALWASASGKVTVPNVIVPMYEMCFTGKGAAGTNTPIAANSQGFVDPTPASIDSANGTSLPKNLWKLATVPVTDTIYIMPATPPPGTVTFTADRNTVVPDASTCVDIKVKNFKNIEYAEFALRYDATKLTYQSINLGANPLTLTAIQATEADPISKVMPLKGVRHVEVEQNFGQGDFLRYIQFSYRGTPATVSDNAAIFSVCFKASAQVGDSSEIKIGSVLIPTAGVVVPIGVWKAIPISGVPVQGVSGLVRVKSALSAALTGINPTCNGGSNGSIASMTGPASCAGGTLSYKWVGPGINANNMTVASPTGLTAGVYTVTITCSAGNVTATSSVTLGQPTAVTSAAAPAIVGVDCSGGSDGSITVSMIGGTAPYTYTWTGPTPIGNVPNATALKAGNYKLTVTDNVGCSFTNSNNNIVVGSPQGINVSALAVPVKCFEGSDGSISTTIGGGTGSFTVQWSGPNGYTGNGTNITGLKGGLYTPTVTDSKGCTQIGQPVNVQTPQTKMIVANAVTSDVSCLNDKNGKATSSVTQGGTIPFLYSWRNTLTGSLASTSANPENLGCGTYNVTIMDGNGCTSVGVPVTVNCPTAALTVTATPTAATCGANGAICLVISGGWTNGTATTVWSNPVLTGNCPTAVASGPYSVTVTDSKNCSTTATTAVAGPPGFTIEPVVMTNLTCFGAGNGALSITPSGGAGGPFEVTWAGAANLTGSSISNLTPGTYTPTVKDALGCTQVFPVMTVTSPAIIVVVDTNVIHQSGSGSNGSIDITDITGGTAPFTYKWDGPNNFNAVTQNITGLAPGVYTITIKDDKNCGFTASYEVKADFSATAVLKKGACGTSADGCITVNVQGTAPGPYTVSWPGGIPQIITTSPADICGFLGGIAYTLTVSNSAGQSFTMAPVTVPVLQPAIVGAEIGVVNEDKKNGYILLSPLPSNAPLNFAWSNGKTGGALVQLDSGTYIVTVTHANGCSSMYTYVLVREYPKEQFNWLQINNPKCKSATDGSIKIQFSGADGPNYQYKWAGPNGIIAGQTTPTLSAQGTGAYTVTVTDERGLQFVYDTLIVSQSQLTVTNVNELSNYNGFQVSGAANCDGVASVAFSGQANGATIAWSNGVTSASNSTLCGGAYGVTVTDGLGCTAVWSDELTFPPTIQSNHSVTKQVTCHGDCDGKARVTVVGGIPPYKVLWSNGQSDDLSTASGFSESEKLCGGTYTVTVTDKNLITTTQTFVLDDPDPVSITFATQEPSTFSTCDGEVIATAEGTSGVTTFAWAVTNRPGKSGADQRAEGLCAGEVVQFSVVDANGCTASGLDSVPYPPDGCLKVGPIITPNGDNLNDYFGITCIQGVNNTLEIYNRWGQLVFSAENYDSAPNGLKGSIYWDGTRNGLELPDGSYFYVLNYTDEDGNEQQQKGYLTLLR